MRISDYLPGLASLRHYDSSWWRSDLLAGISVAAVAVPIAIAYSALTGVPPVHGLYASLLPLVAYAFLGSSRQLILAPDAATCAIVAATVAPLAAADAARYISLTMVLTLLTGVFCIVAGVARLGFLTNFLARPILIGYLNGIAISIILGQLGRLFGFALGKGGAFRQIASFVAHLGETHAVTLVVGLSTLAMLRALKHVAPRLPAPLVAVAAGIVASSAFRLGDRGVALIGAIPAGLPALMVPHLQSDDVEPLVFGAIGLALISFNSAMVTARSFAVKNRYEIDSNQEFIALGVADIGAALLQGFAISGADSRTAVNDSVGGKSQVTGLVAAGVILIVLLFLTAPLALLPVAVLAAVLINASLGLFDLASLRRLRRISVNEFRLSLVALLGVITVGVLQGVVVAVVLAIIMLIVRASNPHDAVLGRTPAHGFHDVSTHPDAVAFPGLLIFRFDASLVFFNADAFKARVRRLVADAAPGLKAFVLDAETMPLLDTTGAATLDELERELADRQIMFAIACARAPVRMMLTLAEVRLGTGHELLFPTVESAVASLA
jgi:high affinity sulfate transporter 1